MKRLPFKNLTRLVASISLLLLALPALAHPDASHGSMSHGLSGFFDGFLHALTDLDHLLAILAVGILAVGISALVVFLKRYRRNQTPGSTGLPR